MQPEQQRIMGYFIEEAKEHLNTIEQSLLNLQSVIEDPEGLNEVFRAAHSIKGGAAMLGLYSMQHTAHSLEDHFKVLKEHPVKVDQKLESLLFKGFDTLQELLEELQSPLGLTDDVADNATEGFELVSAELKTHLALLVSQVSKVPASAERSAEPKVETLLLKPDDGALNLVFQGDIPAKLREMLQLFKQADEPSGRRQLQEICQSLVQVGEQFELPAWIQLIEGAHLAIARPENSYSVLAPALIKEIKAARDLVLAGHPTKIVPSQQLKALAPQKPILALDELDPCQATLAAETQLKTSSPTEVNVGYESLSSDKAESSQADLPQSLASNAAPLDPATPESGVAPSAPLTSPVSGPEGRADSYRFANLFTGALPTPESHLEEVTGEADAETPSPSNAGDEISRQDLRELFGTATLPDVGSSVSETNFASLFDGELADKTQAASNQVEEFLLETKTPTRSTDVEANLCNSLPLHQEGSAGEHSKPWVDQDLKTTETNLDELSSVNTTVKDKDFLVSLDKPETESFQSQEWQPFNLELEQDNQPEVEPELSSEDTQAFLSELSELSDHHLIPTLGQEAPLETFQGQFPQDSSQLLQTSELPDVEDLTPSEQLTPPAEGGSVVPDPWHDNPEFQSREVGHPDAPEALAPPLINLDETLEPPEIRTKE